MPEGRVLTDLPLGPIADAMDRDPDGVALVDDRGVRSWSQVVAELRGAGAALLAGAPDPDQRWGVMGDNAAPTLVAHAASVLAGVGAVALSRQLTLPELADQVEDASIVGVIAGPGSVATAVSALEAGLIGTVVLHSGASTDSRTAGIVAWEDWVRAPAPTSWPDRPARPAMVYTSGTTGRARGTQTRWVLAPVRDHRDYLARLRERAQFPEGPHIVVGPLQHNGPLTAVRHLLLGRPVVIVGRFDGEQVLRVIERYRVTSSVMVPTHFQRLLAVDPDVRDSIDVSSLQLVAHTGSACPPDVKRAMIDWFGPVLVESYGGSESGTLCRIGSQDWLTHPGSVGTVVEPFRVLVVDEDGGDVPPGEVGILAFEAPEGYGVAYHRDEEKTAKAYVRPGAFTLGDMGYVDADGFVFITDRISDMVVSGGVNLYPSESEAALRGHPGVADVAVIGIPHPDLGEQLLALVVPADPESPPSAADLEAYCRDLISAYKIPRRYEFIAELPRNEMQKVDKKALRRSYADDRRTIGD